MSEIVYQIIRIWGTSNHLSRNLGFGLVMHSQIKLKKKFHSTFSSSFLQGENISIPKRKSVNMSSTYFIKLYSILR